MRDFDDAIGRITRSLEETEQSPELIMLSLDEAGEAIDEVCASLLEGAVYEAVDYAISIGANRFLELLTVEDQSDGFFISTATGETDFSTDEVPMLDHLVAGGKKGKDGSRYRVIPVYQGASVDDKKKIAHSLIEQMKSRQKDLEHKRYMSGVDSVKDAAKSLASGIISKEVSIPKHSGAVNLRTASENQSPDKWAIPAQDRDMSQFLAELNRKLKEDIYLAVEEVVNLYVRTS